MTKKKILVLTLAVMMLAACNKTFVTSEQGPLPEHYARVIEGDSKEAFPIEIVITIHLGHNASDCDNSCIRTITSQTTHVNCQGAGNACPVVIKIGGRSTQQKTSQFDAVVDSLWEPTSEDVFEIPARSLVVLEAPEGYASYLNIPEQTLVRDSVTQQFVFRGLFFSDSVAYSND